MEIESPVEGDIAGQIPTLVIFFTRFETLSQLIDAFRQLRPTNLYFASDGPRVASDVAKVQKCRDIINTIDWPCSVTRLYSETNLGLSERSQTAISRVLELESGVLVLEDDCIPSSEIYRYLNIAIRTHGADTRVATYSCFNPLGTTPGLRKAPFSLSKCFRVWGFYVKKRHWNEYQAQLVESSMSILECVREASRYPGFLTSLLKFKILMAARRNFQHGDIAMQKFFFDSGYLSLLPRSSLVMNIGFGPSATHTSFMPLFPKAKSQSKQFFRDIPLESSTPTLRRIDVLEGYVMAANFPLWILSRLRFPGGKPKFWKGRHD